MICWFEALILHIGYCDCLRAVKLARAKLRSEHQLVSMRPIIVGYGMTRV